MRYQVEQQLNFQLAFLNFSAPEVLEVPAELMLPIAGELQEKFGVNDFPSVIHKNDLMFQHHLYHHPDLAEALRHYFRVGVSVSRELAGLFEIPVNGRLLDFGAGYGRLTRFLPSFFLNGEILASEIKPQAVDFLKKHIGIPGIMHRAEPDSFPEEEFDGILALSVFTHLPEELFEAWLARLTLALRPGGKLILTWNDLAERTGNSESRFLYTADSEDSFFRSSDRLFNEESYGLTFVSREYLEQLARQNALATDFTQQGFTGNQKLAIFQR